MDKIIVNKILKITIWATIFLLLVVLFTSDGLSTLEIFRKILSTVSFVVFFWAFYFSFGWKLPILKYIVFRENLNGTWFGEYNSRDSKEEVVYQGEISVVIRQSFLKINITSYTDSYVSFSYGEAVLHNVNNNNNQLVYLYSQNQYNPTDNLSRKGTSELFLLKEDEQNRLFGEFWTNHNSKGKLNLQQVSSKHLTSFRDTKKLTHEI